MSSDQLKDNDWQQKLHIYPSLKKLEELGDAYVEWKDGREDALLKYILSHPNVASMKGNPKLILDAMDDFANNQDFLISVGVNKAQIIADIIRENRPITAVEMGGYLGYSAILLGHELRQVHGSNPNIRVWSLEYEPHFVVIARELVSLAGLADNVTVVVGAADESMRNLSANGELTSIDFLLIDHVEELYERDFKVAMDELKMLRSGAVVVADNVIRPGAPQYRQHIRGRADVGTKGVKALIMPGEFEDELEVTKVL